MIDPREIAELAGLYDQYANAIDPLPPERQRAKRLFYGLLERLHVQDASNVQFDTFRLEAVRRCKDYLRRNP